MSEMHIEKISEEVERAGSLTAIHKPRWLIRTLSRGERCPVCGERPRGLFACPAAKEGS